MTVPHPVSPLYMVGDSTSPRLYALHGRWQYLTMSPLYMVGDSNHPVSPLYMVGDSTSPCVSPLHGRWQYLTMVNPSRLACKYWNASCRIYYSGFVTISRNFVVSLIFRCFVIYQYPTTSGDKGDISFSFLFRFVVYQDPAEKHGNQSNKTWSVPYAVCRICLAYVTITSLIWCPDMMIWTTWYF